MTTQSILDSGQLAGDESAQELQDARLMAEWLIDGFRNCTWGQSADEAIARLTALIDEIDKALKRHFGSDGMTPVHP